MARKPKRRPRRVSLPPPPPQALLPPAPQVYFLRLELKVSIFMLKHPFLIHLKKKKLPFFSKRE
jgi:hypothetical protein